MTEEIKDDDLFDPDSDDIEVIFDGEEQGDESADEQVESEAVTEKLEELQEEIGTLNDNYARLYAEFDNYKKRVAKDKQELARYANESLVFELLDSLDNLETALKHASEDKGDGLVEGVRMTLRGMYKTLEKFGLKLIEAEGKNFDPEFHHAIAQIERDDIDENMVVEQMRSGFMFGDKVLRASMVSVSQRPQ